MCDQTIPYATGDLVWVKFGHFWWPGKVVDRTDKDIPDDVKNDLAKKKKEPIIVVRFGDNLYDIICSLNSICFYDCANKMEYLKKGYSMYVKQKKSQSIRYAFDMEKFVEDVHTIEKEIEGGNVNIFEQFKRASVNTNNTSQIIRDLFSTKKQKQKKKEQKKKMEYRKSLPNIRPPVPKKPVPKKVMNPDPVVNPLFRCQLKDGCNFTTNRFDNLKRHMAVHKLAGNDEVTATKKTSIANKSTSGSISSSVNTNKVTQSSKKRKNVKNKRTDNKKIKLQDELLKDWELDDEDAEDKLDKRNKIFDFDENDGSTLVENINERHDSNIIASSKEHSETNESLNAPMFISKTVLNSRSPEPESIDKEEEKDKLQNDFVNEIDNQIKNAGSTLNQLSRFEETTLSDISGNVSKPNADSLTENQSTNSIENIHNETKNVSNNSDNKQAIEEEQTNNDKNVPSNSIVSNIQFEQLNDEQNGEESVIFNCDSENENIKSSSTGDDVQEEKNNSVVTINFTEDSNPECMLSKLSTPEWVTQEKWKLSQNNGLQEADSFSAELKLPACHKSTQPEFFMGVPQPVEQDVCSIGDLIDSLSSNKTNIETGGSGDHSLPDTSSFRISRHFTTIGRDLEPMIVDSTPECIDSIGEPLVTPHLLPDLPTGYVRRTIRVRATGGDKSGPEATMLQQYTDEELLLRPEVRKFREYLASSDAGTEGGRVFVDLQFN